MPEFHCANFPTHPRESHRSVYIASLRKWSLFNSPNHRSDFTVQLVLHELRPYRLFCSLFAFLHFFTFTVFHFLLCATRLSSTANFQAEVRCFFCGFGWPRIKLRNDRPIVQITFSNLLSKGNLLESLNVVTSLRNAFFLSVEILGRMFEYGYSNCTIWEVHTCELSTEASLVIPDNDLQKWLQLKIRDLSDRLVLKLWTL